MDNIEIEEKKDIKLCQELKDEAQKKFESLKKKEKISLSEIKDILEIYDIDPNINYFYLKKCLDNFSNEIKKNDSEIPAMDIEDEINDKSEKISIFSFSQEYLYYINSLSLKQKRELNEIIKTKTNVYNYLKNYLNNNSNIKKIYQSLIFIIKNKFDFKKTKNLFNSEYYVNLEKFHIPLIYGTKELKWAAFLSDVYSFLFENHLKQQKNYISNIYQKINKHEKNIIIKVDKKIKLNKKAITIIKKI